jgi:hypothetical protein
MFYPGYLKLKTSVIRKTANRFLISFLMSGWYCCVIAGVSNDTSGPILVIVNSSSSNPFGAYAGEILKAEGFNEFQIENITGIDSLRLSKFDIVILTETKLTSDQKILLQNYVNSGGNLLAFKPDLSQIATLCGVEKSAGAMDDGYIKITDNNCIGDGLETSAMKYHSTAERLTPNFGAHAVAELYDKNNTATGYAAIVQSCYGAGKVVAFSYDLCRSLVYMRQGNPGWAAQERDGWEGLRPGDLFFDGNTGYNDLSKTDIQQADEQMRIVSHTLEWFAGFKKPLPKLWYLPDQKNAVTVYTGDSDFAGTDTDNDEFNTVKSFGGHASVYLVENKMPPSEIVRKWQADGHEVAVHFNNQPDRTDPDWQITDSVFDRDLGNFKKLYGFNPVSVRNHWIVWCSKDSTGKPEFTAQAEIEASHGLKLDCNYYSYSQDVSGDVGYFTGSALPIKFARSDGKILDIYNSETQIADECWGEKAFDKYKVILDRALNNEKYGWINVNFHPSMWNQYKPKALQVLQYSKDNGIPVWSAKDMYDFTRMKNSAGFENIIWTNNMLSFTLNASVNGYGEMTVMIPYIYMGRTLKSCIKNRKVAEFSLRTIKGIQYAMINSASGIINFEAQYGASERTTYGNNGKPWSIPGRIESENYDESVPGDPSCFDTTPGSEAPADEYYRPGDADFGVDPLLSLVDVGWVDSAEWLEYTVNVKQTGNYKVTVCIATPLNNIRFGPVNFDGVQKIGLVEIPNTGDWGSDLKGGHKFQEVDCGRCELTAGVHKMRVYMGRAGFTVNWVNFTF